MLPLLLVLPLLLAAENPSTDLTDALAAIRSVDVYGRGHREAIVAWPEVASAPLSRLPEILAAFDGANPLAANWLRSAVETIVERAGAKAVPVDLVVDWVSDPRHDGRGRDLAFELLDGADRERSESLLPKLLDDPYAPLRRKAVANLLREAEANDGAGAEPAVAIAAYRRALNHAVDRDQVLAIAEGLRRHGEEVDLVRHFGLLQYWYIVGPFDNSGGRGFNRPFPPETGIDLQAQYQGKHGPVRWSVGRAKSDEAVVDFNELLGEQKAVVAYAYARFTTENEDAELRFASPNATKVWINGRLAAATEIYHAGSQFDQYIVPVKLRQGENEVLVKVCQNEQTQSWARGWKLQFRVSDRAGAGVARQNQSLATPRAQND